MAGVGFPERFVPFNEVQALGHGGNKALAEEVETRRRCMRDGLCVPATLFSLVAIQPDRHGALFESPENAIRAGRAYTVGVGVSDVDQIKLMGYAAISMIKQASVHSMVARKTRLYMRMHHLSPNP